MVIVGQKIRRVNHWSGRNTTLGPVCTQQTGLASLICLEPLVSSGRWRYLDHFEPSLSDRLALVHRERSVYFSRPSFTRPLAYRPSEPLTNHCCSSRLASYPARFTGELTQTESSQKAARKQASQWSVGHCFIIGKFCQRDRDRQARGAADLGSRGRPCTGCNVSGSPLPRCATVSPAVFILPVHFGELISARGPPNPAPNPPIRQSAAIGRPKSTTQPSGLAEGPSSDPVILAGVWGRHSGLDRGRQYSGPFPAASTVVCPLCSCCHSAGQGN